MPPPLIIRFGALGDMVLTTPALRALAARHGQPCDIACIGGWARALFQGLPYVGAVHTIASRGAPYLISPDQWRLVAALRTYRGGSAYLMDGDRKSDWFATHAGLTLSGSMRTMQQRMNHHQIEGQARVCGFADAGGAYTDGFIPVPELMVSAGEQAECQAWLARRIPSGSTVVLMHPGNKKTMSWRKRSGNLKEWPHGHWVAVAQAVLSALPQARVLLTGTASEARMTIPIAAACADERVLSVAGETPLRRLFALLRSAHSLISVDTGPAHAAAALGCPLVVLFGQTDPRANRPVSAHAPVQVVTDPPGAPVLDGEGGWRAHHQMSAILPQAVIAAWRSLGAADGAQLSASSAR